MPWDAAKLFINLGLCVVVTGPRAYTGVQRPEWQARSQGQRSVLLSEIDIFLSGLDACTIHILAFLAIQARELAKAVASRNEAMEEIKMSDIVVLDLSKRSISLAAQVRFCP